MFDGGTECNVKRWYLPGAIGSTDYQLMTAASCLSRTSSPPPSRAELLGSFEQVVRVTRPPAQADPWVLVTG